MLMQKTKNAFTISGTVNKPGSLKKVYLLEGRQLASLQLSTPTNLSDQGKFQFKHNAPYANLFKVRIGGTIFDLIAKKW